MSAPRVLVCGTVFAQGLGGVQRHNRELLPRAAQLLEARGGELAVLLGRDGLDFELPATVRRIESDVPSAPALKRFWSEGTALRTATEHGERYDLVHTAHLPTPHRLSVPFTLVLHDLKSVASPFSTMARRLAGHVVIEDAVRRAAHVFFVSHALASEWRSISLRDLTNSSVLHNGSDHLSLVPRAPASPPFLLFVGRIEPRKDVETLLRALALAADLPPVLLAGAEQGQHGKRLRAIVAELHLEERVQFIGPQSDDALAQLYSTCAAVVLPSLREGFDLPLVEALRARAPVIASDLAVHRELAADHARYFTPCNPRRLVEAYRALDASSAEPPALPSWDKAAEQLVARWCELHAARR